MNIHSLITRKKPLLPALKELNANQLKIIALLAMTLDHLTFTICPGFQYAWWLLILHVVGRLTAPLFWFLVVEGFIHTRNVANYILRLFIFAVISHFSYTFCFDLPFIPFQNSIFNQTSVIWTLTCGVLALCVSELKIKHWITQVLTWLLVLLSVCGDWGIIAVLSILTLYAHRKNPKQQIKSLFPIILCYVFFFIIFIDRIYGLIQLGVFLVYPFITRYTGARGNWKGMKWFFYVYYPLHLFLLGLLRLYVLT